MKPARAYIPAIGGWLAIGLQALMVLKESQLAEFDYGRYSFPWLLGATALGCFVLSVAVGFMPAFLVSRRTDSYALKVAVLVLALPGYFLMPSAACGLAGLDTDVQLTKFRHDCLKPGDGSHCADWALSFGEARVPAGLSKEDTRAAEFALWRAGKPDAFVHSQKGQGELVLSEFERAAAAGNAEEAARLGGILSRTRNVYAEGDLGVRVEMARLRAMAESADRLEAERKKECDSAKAALPGLKEGLRRDLASASPARVPPASLLPALMQLHRCEPESEAVKDALKAIGM